MEKIAQSIQAYHNVMNSDDVFRSIIGDSSKARDSTFSSSDVTLKNQVAEELDDTPLLTQSCLKK